MAKYAANTTVPVSKSKQHLEDLITRYGATTYMTGQKADGAVIQFEMSGRAVRFILPLPDRAATEFTKDRNGWALADSTAQKKYDQAVRQRWRALILVVKAKLEAVETGITCFDQEFMAHIVLPNGQTVGDDVTPKIIAAYETQQMPEMLPMLTVPAIEDKS